MTVKQPAMVVFVATTLAMLTLPAQADVHRFTDARRDTSSSVDIWSVQVDNSTTDRDKVVVVVQQDDVRPGDFITIYVGPGELGALGQAASRQR